MDLSRVAAHRPVRVRDQERDAAVLVPVVDGASDEDGRFEADDSDREPALVFTKRADHLGEHPGQMSFPGGGREPSDGDLRDTAVREVDEEIGLRRDEISFVGQLDDIATVTSYSVTPFVGRVPDRSYVPDEREVDEVVVLPISGLTDPANYELEKRVHPKYGEALVHFFHVHGYTVWGATGRILLQFLDLAVDWTPPDRDPEVVEMDPDA
ncbi:NUDIX hydrolase [Halobacterium litoreum]|uniref:NUDIX hydrolase n=1 Tax=Halobacterium litoreum TaxID=2039234 RepID=A0ABD5NH15_9EURY|nr:CoA pyrophosphatase [Halobacterium litoreum]UHH12761.1 CoA pyrophosphatase [Halobacterium litoreum]